MLELLGGLRVPNFFDGYNDVVDEKSTLENASPGIPGDPVPPGPFPVIE